MRTSSAPKLCSSPAENIEPDQKKGFEKVPDIHTPRSQLFRGQLFRVHEVCRQIWSYSADSYSAYMRCVGRFGRTVIPRT